MSVIDSRQPTLARCPYELHRGLFGAEMVAAMLDYVAAKEPEFRPARAYDRRSAPVVDPGRRDCVLFDDLGPFRARIETRIGAVAAKAALRLGIRERPGPLHEVEFAAYGDGGHFNAHVDLDASTERVRIVSCVYYFAATPRRFSGGALRLYALPSSRGDASARFVDVDPETDMLVAFPSWLRHEVVPVRVPSRAWTDRRFSINAWLHRA